MVAVIKPGPDVQVRAMRQEDLDRVGELERESYDFPWSAGIFGDCLKAGYPCWILSVEGAIAGYGILSTGADEAHLLNICVGAAYRGRGLGRHLLCRLLDIARWNGAQQVFLEVRPSNLLAKALYESVGFTQIGRRPRYYPAHEGREDAIVMALETVASAKQD